MEGRYVIQCVLGVGGMGAVYLARDMHFPNAEKYVAVKEMINQAPDLEVRKTIIQTFEREANILVTLSHPSIPQIIDYFTHNERSYLVLEYVQGRDIEDIIKGTTEVLPIEQIVAWAIELCDVLHYLHTHKPTPIVFRDVKPSNIMINQHGHVVLVDFGIAKLFQSGKKGTMIGTEGYAPPEQYRGEATHLADIYALGATMHHLLTRCDPRLEPPFTFAERDITQINPSVSKELASVVHKALSYVPEERYSSALEMKEALIKTAKDTGILPGISGRLNQGKQQQNVEAKWAFRCEDEIRGSPFFDGKFVYVGAYDNNVYAIVAEDGKFAWKYPAEGGVVSRPAVFEDLLFFGSEDAMIYALSARNGRLNWTYQTEGPIRCSPAVAEGHVFIGSDDGYFYAVNMITGRLAWRVELGIPIRSMPCIVRDLIYFGCDNGDVLCVNMRGEVKWRFKAKRGVVASPVIYDGVLYISSLDAMVYALDAKTGWATWRFRMGKGSISTPFVLDRYLVVGSADSNIYGIDITNGKEIWRYQTEHQVSGSPIGNEDTVYCGSADGNVYCLDIRNGKKRWHFSTGGPITGTPALNDDIIYIGSVDHHLYAIQA